MFGVSQIWLIGLAAGLGVMVLLFAVGKVPVRYNVRNLSVRWRTTAMTALAFTLVIALLTVMMAFVNGMNRLTDSSGQPGNVILLSAGVTDEAFSNLGFSDTGDIENQPDVVRENGQPLCSKETYIVLNQPIENALPNGPKRRFLQLRGIDDPLIAARVHGVRLHDGGNWFSEAGVQARGGGGDAASQASLIEVVLGEGAARELGRDPNSKDFPSVQKKKRLDTGDVFKLGTRQWLVAGVMQSSGSTFDSEVWAKRSLVGGMFGKEMFTSLVLRTVDAAAAERAKNFFNNDFKKASLQAVVETEYFASLSQNNKQFAYAISLVAIVMAIGGVFGVMNTMFAAIAQRTKDIGVLRILGYARWQILASFLLESLLIALVGGLLGCALGSLANGWTATSIVSGGQGGGKTVVLKLIVDSNILAQGLVLTLAMGLCGGILPALSAMRLRPLEALR